MIVTTTSGIQGKEIIEYIDIVNGEAIMGANIVRDLFASVRDVVGGRAGAYESKLKDARDCNGMLVLTCEVVRDQWYSCTYISK